MSASPALPNRRRLIVMRHAKSSHNTEAPTDHARPLNRRGRRDAPRMGHYLQEIGWQPEYVISSDARRTQETLQGLQHGLDAQIDHAVHKSLYCGGYEELLAVAQTIPETAETVLALGHNPDWEEVVAALSGQSVVLKTATCALLVLAKKCSWPEGLRKRGKWQLENVIYPREI